MKLYFQNKNKINAVLNMAKRGKKSARIFNRFSVCFRFSQNNNIKKKFLVLFFASSFLSSCENDIRVVQALGQKTVGIEEAKNIEAYQSIGGRVEAKLTAPLMYKYLFDTPRYEFPKTLHVDFYDSSAHVESKLFARFGSYYENDRKVFLKDSVIVFNIKHDTLWTKELTWDQERQIFYTDKPVHLSQSSTPRQIIYGRGLHADQNFKSFSIDSTGEFFTGKQNIIIVPDSTY